jgi:hypothetical protein
MQLSEIIRVWYSLATGGDVDRSDVFFRFIALWVAFNALYASRHSSDIGSPEGATHFAYQGNVGGPFGPRLGPSPAERLSAKMPIDWIKVESTSKPYLDMRHSTLENKLFYLHEMTSPRPFAKARPSETRDSIHSGR